MSKWCIIQHLNVNELEMSPREWIELAVKVDLEARLIVSAFS
jgi:hypothetical protein